MLSLRRLGHVTQIEMASRRSRLVGYGVNAFLVRGALIDTGFHGVRRAVARLLDALRPEGVILTHHHEDHAGNIQLAASRGLPIQASPETMVAVRTPEAAGLYRRFVWDPMPRLSSPVVQFRHPTLEMVFTPGHSPEHHAVWDAERETLFSGDLFLGVKVRVARPGEQPRVLVGSLRSAAAMRPRTMFDSHRGQIPDPVSALNAKADWLETTIDAIDRRMAAGDPDEVIRDEVLGREDAVYWFSRGDLSRLNFVKALR